jgi:hypothetical protein
VPRDAGIKNTHTLQALRLRSGHLSLEMVVALRAHYADASAPSDGPFRLLRKPLLTYLKLGPVTQATIALRVPEVMGETRCIM